MESATARLQALLGPLSNYERRRLDPPRWTLDTMRSLLDRPGAPRLAGALVQVGGSKGKGTTTLYLDSLAAAAGLRTGTYMSPHLQSMLERVRLQGRNVDETTLCRALEPVLVFARNRGLEVSFFEAMAAAALECFAVCDVELGVLEVGLGGRLDATTAVPVAASIVTSIELEHTEILGNTLESVAGEKAWVLRAGRPAFTAARAPALGVLREHAARVGCELMELGRDIVLEEVTQVGTGWSGTIRDAGGARHRFELRDGSAFELPALALAVACLRRLWPDRELALQPVARPSLPGRCEVFECADGQPLVLDGAHTESSAMALVTELRRRFPSRPVAVLFGSAAGKRWGESLKCLLSIVDKFRVTALAETTTESPVTIVRWLQSCGVDAEEVSSARDGLQWLADQPGVRVVTGSFYLVGAARSQLNVFGLSDLA